MNFFDAIDLLFQLQTSRATPAGQQKSPYIHQNEENIQMPSHPSK
jgi:hypothetical protein